MPTIWYNRDIIQKGRNVFDNRHGSANRDNGYLNHIRSTGVGVFACPVAVEQAQIQSEQQQQEQQQEYAAQLSWEASKR